MIDGYCGYNCSQPPESLTPYPDVSGIGVVIGYVGSAGFAVAIIAVYYFLAFRPELDPFRTINENGSQTQANTTYEANVVDATLLSLIRRYWNGKPPELFRNPVRLDNCLLKCVLNLSDLQLLSGFSILIGGYASLRCGTSVYHWQILTRLAWFSSITHLSCLTFLRTHLHNHTTKRAWRVVAMGALVILLSVAIVYSVEPDRNPEYRRIMKDMLISPKTPHLPTSGALPHEYAVCFFRPDVFIDPATIISIILLAGGFISRVARLYRPISVGVLARFRGFMREHFKRILRKTYIWSHAQGKPFGLRCALCYSPLLGVFWVARASLDLWSSMVFEVWWLLVSFAWGIGRLTGSRFLENSHGAENWTFGQVAPVVFLAAPLVAIIEAFGSESSDLGQPLRETSAPFQPPAPCTTIGITHTSIRQPDDDTDRVIHQNSYIYMSIVVYMGLMSIVIGVWIFFGLWYPPLVRSVVEWVYSMITYIPITVFGGALTQFFVGSTIQKLYLFWAGNRQRGWIPHTGFTVCNVGFAVWSLFQLYSRNPVGESSALGLITWAPYLGASVALYVIFSLIDGFWLRVK